MYDKETNCRSTATLMLCRKLDGSCQCGAVEFTLQSQTPVPYQLCACSICRKVGGYSGSVNLGGISDSLKVIKGEDMIKYLPILPVFQVVKGI